MSAISAELRMELSALHSSMRALVELFRVSPGDSVTKRMALSSLKLLLCEEGSQTFKLMHTRVFLTLLAVRPGSTSVSRAAAAEALAFVLRSYSFDTGQTTLEVLLRAGVMPALNGLLRVQDSTSLERLCALNLFLDGIYEGLSGDDPNLVSDDFLFASMNLLQEARFAKEQIKVMKYILYWRVEFGWPTVNDILYEQGGLFLLKALLDSDRVVLKVKTRVLRCMGDCGLDDSRPSEHQQILMTLALPVALEVITKGIPDAPEDSRFSALKRLSDVMVCVWAFEHLLWRPIWDVISHQAKALDGLKQVVLERDRPAGKDVLLPHYYVPSFYREFCGLELIIKFCEYVIEGKTKAERIDCSNALMECFDLKFFKRNFFCSSVLFSLQSFYQDAEDAEEKDTAEKLAGCFDISLPPPPESLLRWDWLKGCSALGNDQASFVDLNAQADLTKRARVEAELKVPAAQTLASPLLCEMLRDAQRVCITAGPEEEPHRVISEYAGMVAMFL